MRSRAVQLDLFIVVDGGVTCCRFRMTRMLRGKLVPWNSSLTEEILYSTVATVVV